MKVLALTNRCIASGACVLAASQVFSQRESDGVVELLQERPSRDRLKQVQQAVAACTSRIYLFCALPIVFENHAQEEPRSQPSAGRA